MYPIYHFGYHLEFYIQFYYPSGGSKTMPGVISGLGLVCTLQCQINHTHLDSEISDKRNRPNFGHIIQNS